MVKFLQLSIHIYLTSDLIFHNCCFNMCHFITVSRSLISVYDYHWITNNCLSFVETLLSWCLELQENRWNLTPLTPWAVTVVKLVERVVITISECFIVSLSWAGEDQLWQLISKCNNHAPLQLSQSWNTDIVGDCRWDISSYNTLHFVMTNIDNLETVCSALLDNACKNYPENDMRFFFSFF